LRHQRSRSLGLPVRGGSPPRRTWPEVCARSLEVPRTIRRAVVERNVGGRPLSRPSLFLHVPSRRLSRRSEISRLSQVRPGAYLCQAKNPVMHRRCLSEKWWIYRMNRLATAGRNRSGTVPALCPGQGSGPQTSCCTTTRFYPVLAHSDTHHTVVSNRPSLRGHHQVRRCLHGPIANAG
jgi:hypothetical protein